MAKVKFGLIGAGQIAYSAADQINKHDDAEVVAATDLSAPRLAKLCEDKGIPNAHSTAEALLADSSVDAVYVAVPNKFHAPLAIQALEAGKHVILEKPFAMNTAEAEAVIAAAEKAGKVFTVGMNQRFVENHQKIKALVEAGKLGEIYHAKAFWYRRSGIPTLGTWFGNKALAGGGCLNDIGVHYLDLCLYALDAFDPVSVSGTTYTKFGNRGLGGGKWGISDKTESVFDVEDFATALIRFKSGLTVCLDATWACHMEDANRQGVLLYGTEAGADVATGKLFEQDPIREGYSIIDDVSVGIKYPAHCRFANFIEAILGREELCVKPEQALAVQKILDAVQESSRTGKEVIL